MKKLFAIALAALAIGFASCSEGTQKGDDVVAMVENLKTQLEAGDATALQGALETVQDKISELVAKDPETAKTYVAKVQEFLKANSEKVVALVGDNVTAQGIVTTLVNAPADVVVSALAGGQTLADKAKEAASLLQQSADSTQNAISQAAEEKVNEAVEDAKEKVNEKVNEAVENVNEKINEGANQLLKEAGLK
ncbi:MAG: hypothetical protein J6Z14_09785 [Prevotella sp.]|nr:hypothetical protein [Prevotella sp.]